VGKSNGEKRVMKPGQIAHADVAQGIAVIGPLQREELCLFGPWSRTLPPVLERHLQGDLDGGGAVVGVEDACQAGRAASTRRRAQLDGGHVGQAQQGAVSDGVELLAKGVIEFGNAMAMDVTPQRRDAVEVFAAVQVDEEAAARLADNQGLAGGVFLHGRERDARRARDPIVRVVHGWEWSWPSNPGEVCSIVAITLRMRQPPRGA